MSLRLIDADPDFIKKAAKYYETLNLEQVADVFGIPRSELVSYMKEDPELSKAMKAAKALRCAEIGDVLYDKARNPSAAYNNCTLYFCEHVMGMSGKKPMDWEAFSDDADGMDISSIDDVEATRRYQEMMKGDK